MVDVKLLNTYGGFKKSEVLVPTTVLCTTIERQKSVGRVLITYSYMFHVEHIAKSYNLMLISYKI